MMVDRSLGLRPVTFADAFLGGMWHFAAPVLALAGKQVRVSPAVQAGAEAAGAALGAWLVKHFGRRTRAGLD